MLDPTPLYVFLGTKAQYIKTSPVMAQLDCQGIDYELIDSGQHANITGLLRPQLGVRNADVRLGTTSDIVSIRVAAMWFLTTIARSVLNRRWLNNQVFRKGPGLCIVHGDTPSTLLATLMARLAGSKVAHIEAGLRSYKWLKPFPEEIIRVVTMRLSHILFAPSQQASDNLALMQVSGEVIDVGQNTNIDALYRIIASAPPVDFAPAYSLMTIHRVETLMNRSRLTTLVRWAVRIAHEMPLFFVLHEPTRLKLEQYELMSELRQLSSITLLSLQPYPEFVSRIAASEFVVTDGGSIQEECHYLGVPCLLARSESERHEGIGDGVVIGAFDDAILDDFLRTYPTLRKRQRVANTAPSMRIVNELTSRFNFIHAPPDIKANPESACS